MTKSADVATYREEILSRPLAARVRLVQDLMDSFDSPGDATNAGAAWADLVEARLDALTSGETPVVPGPEALRRVRGRNVWRGH